MPFVRLKLICQVWRYVRIVGCIKVTRMMIVTSIIGGAGAKRPLHAEHGAGQIEIHAKNFLCCGGEPFDP